MARLSTIHLLVGVLSWFLSLAAAQSAAPPQCGVNIIISAVSSSGCSISDAQCLCTNTKVINNVKKELPKSCKKPEDQATYAGFFNAICVDFPTYGFPINFTQSATDTSDASHNGIRAGLWAVPLVAMGAVVL